MDVQVQEKGGVILIAPSGDIDGKTAPDFQDAVVSRMQPGGRIVINMAQVPFMSSAGLRAMLLVYKEAKGRRINLALTQVNQDILKSMSATGFLTFFVVCDSEDDAIRKVS